jgi:hypothetical protein
VHDQAAIDAQGLTLMYSERGDTRQPITFATSSGRSIRPKGIWWRRRRVNSSGLSRRKPTFLLKSGRTALD